MIQSPTEKGVVVIGGLKVEFEKNKRKRKARGHDEHLVESNALIELSGDSVESLKWTILEQKLKYPRYLHLSFPVPNEVVNDLKTKYDSSK